jgi:tRNA1Val (adenine37-N6)-methyltransferase
METLDSIKIRNFEVRVFQSKSGYRFSLDALLLADFPSLKSCRNILELGAGSGVVSLLLALKYPKAKVTGVEIQDSLYKRAVRNAEVNNLPDRVDFIHGDLRELPTKMPAGSFELCVMNPPFRKPGTGRISPADERASARHELKGGIEEAIKTARIMLKNRGRVCIIYHPDRLGELITLMKSHSLEPKRLLFVHSHKGDEARMVLVEAVKEGSLGLKVLPPLFIYEKEREYTAEMRDFYGFPPLDRT